MEEVRERRAGMEEVREGGGEREGFNMERRI